MAVRAVLPQFYVGDNPDTLAGAQIIGGSIIDPGAPDINKLEVPHIQLALALAPLSTIRRKSQTKYVYAKVDCSTGTDKVIQYESEPVESAESMLLKTS